MIRIISNVIVFLLCTFVLVQIGNAQEIPKDYLFLEVVDSSGRPVADASIQIQKYGRQTGSATTDKNGEAPLSWMQGQNFRTVNFIVSKPGYFSYEDIGNLGNYSSRWKGHRAKLELLKVPKTAAERELVDVEQRKRELFVAAKTSDSARVRRLLGAGLSPNLTTTDLRGVPIIKDIPLIAWVAASGDGETVKILLSAGADVRNKAKPGNGALGYYIEAEQYSHDLNLASDAGTYAEGLLRLLRAGADTKATYNDRGHTALMLAVISGGSLGTLKILLDAGAPVNATATGGYTALMMASVSSNFEKVNLLLKSGADPNAIAYYGYESKLCTTALTSAVGNHAVDIIRALIANKADLNLACPNGETALTMAVGGGKTGVVKLLLGAGVDLKGDQGRRALAIARQCFSYNPDCAEILTLLEAAGVLKGT